MLEIDDVANVLEPYRCSVAVGHDHVAVGVGVEELVIGVERECLARALEVALGLVEGCGGECGANVLEPDPARGELGRIDLNMGGVRLLSRDDHLGNAAYGRELLGDDRIGVVVNLVERQRIGIDGIDEDGAVRRVVLLVGRRIGQVLGQKPARRVDRRLHVAGSAVDAAGELELQRDGRGPEAARRGHLRQPRNGRELLLERGRDRGGHGLGARTRKLRADRDGREIHVRNGGYRQQAVGRGTEHQDPRHEQRGGDRPADENLRNAHGQPNLAGSLRKPVTPAQPAGAVAASLSILTLAPLVSRYCPSTTTRSPEETPFVITARPSCTDATSTSRRSTLLSGLIT